MAEKDPLFLTRGDVGWGGWRANFPLYPGV